MPAALRHLPRTLSLTILLLAAACSDGPTTAPSDQVAITLSVVSGNTQSGVVGQELPSALVVKATKPGGGPIYDLIVDFKVTSGGGSMYAEAASTDSHGQAQDYWTLGTSTAEPQSVEVRTVLSDGTKQVLGTFTATPLAGPAVRIVPHAGGGDTVWMGTPVPIAPAVRVTDRYDNPVPNLPVTFAVASGGGGVTGASPLSNAAGVATVGSWTVGLTSGQNTLTATAAGSGLAGNPVTFAALASNWISRAPMPTPRALLGVGVINGVLYAVGGQGGNDGNPYGILGTVEAYDPATNSWSTKATMPTPRSGIGVGVVNGVLYAVGGYTSGNFGIITTGTVEAYDPATNSWSTKASMPTPRREPRVGVINGSLYAVDRYYGTLEAYDPAANSWTTKAPLPTLGSGVDVGVVNGVLYAVGGYGNNGYLYDPATDTWSTEAPMPTPRYGVVLGIMNAVLYAVGGYTDTGIFLGTVEAFDPATNTWSTKVSMPTPRQGMGVGVVNGVLYAVGGQGGNYRPLVTVEAFVP
jgi:small nuclear ribonucleoprotein (snRNP)-like protein